MLNQNWTVTTMFSAVTLTKCHR